MIALLVPPIVSVRKVQSRECSEFMTCPQFVTREVSASWDPGVKGHGHEGEDPGDEAAEGAVLAGALLVRTPLKDADVSDAIFTRALFYRVDIRGVSGLESAVDLATGVFHATIVTDKEKAALSSIIESSIFDVQAE